MMNTVLYVDDEPVFLDLGKLFLERSGSIRVETASSVEEAIEKIPHLNCDAIVSDYQMPVQDGIEFLRYIRSHYADIPFILFTGRGREEIAIEALNNGADFYIQKGGEQKSQFTELEYKLRHAIDRKRTHDELQESQNRMAGLIDSLPDATFAINKDRTVIAWNKSIEQLTGIPSGAILGTGNYLDVLTHYNENRPVLVDLVLKKSRDPAKTWPGVSCREDKLVSELFSPNLYQGKGAYVWIVASPLYDSKGRVIGAIESIRDISDKKKAEEKLRFSLTELNAAYEQLTATEEELRQNYDELSKSQQELRQSEERYRRVVEDQTEFICRFSPEGRLTFVNDAYCRYFGLDRAACIGSAHMVHLPPEDQPLMREHFAALTPENPVGSIEHRLIMPDGTIRWQRWSDRAVFDRDGRVVEYQSVGRDITERKESVERLAQVHEDLYMAYEQLTATEEELRQNYDELSKSQQELRQSEERYRKVVEDQTEFICRFSPDGSHIFVNDAYCRYFKKSRREIIEQRFIPDIAREDRGLLKDHFAAITPDHPVRTVEHRIRMPDGEIRWQQWSDRGIFNENGAVIEYQSVGRDITERKRIEQALCEANKKMNLLSAVTRHDILNQLTALQGYLDLIEKKSWDPETVGLARHALQTANVIRGQILFTQQYQDIGVNIPRWQDIGSSARSAVSGSGTDNVWIDERLDGTEIFSDPLLKTVFFNLFENAAMHGGKGVRVQVSGMTTPAGFTLVIEDNGTGIPAPDKEKIFLKGYGSHTGLGLFYVREVLAITGLTIEETGAPGKGARFEIHIPNGMFRRVS